MGSSNQARPLGRAAFSPLFLRVFLLFLHANRASWINIYLYIILYFFHTLYKAFGSRFPVAYFNTDCYVVL